MKIPFPKLTSAEWRGVVAVGGALLVCLFFWPYWTFLALFSLSALGGALTWVVSTMDHPDEKRKS